MGANLRDIKKRIVGVQKTQKITRAMKMVSAAKLARATRAIKSARPYAEKIQQVLGAVSSGLDADSHPLFAPHENTSKVEFVVLSSDRGLCGAFNANIMKRALELMEKRRGDAEISLVAVGRKTIEFFARRNVEIGKSWKGISQVNADIAREIAGYLMDRYRNEEVDEVVLVYSEFQSALTQSPTGKQLLPVVTDESEADGEYEIEPGPKELLQTLVPQAVEFAVFRALLENQAGEHGARMTAMENATNNTSELIETLTLDFNKARQAAITAELVEIVSGADAL